MLRRTDVINISVKIRCPYIALISHYDHHWCYFWLL